MRGMKMGKRLSESAQGKSYSVINIAGGRGAVRKLNNMGIVPGTDITVVQLSGSGPIVIEARGTRLAIGRGMAEKVLVKEK